MKPSQHDKLQVHFESVKYNLPQRKEHILFYENKDIISAKKKKNTQKVL